MKKIMSLALVCMLLFCLCACDFEPTLVGTTPVQQSDAAPSSNSKTFQLGDVVELSDVTVGFVDVVTSTGSDFNKPQEGNIFVLCEFEITNNSSEELAVSSMLSFEAYCDGYSTSLSLQALMEKGSRNQLDGSVAAGKKMKGVVGYEVPAEWEELEVHYTIDLLHGNKIVFVAGNK